MDADVIVIGAGLAGLSAADALRRAGRRVMVLEARDRVGGRTWTDTYEGVRIERGGQWIGPDQPLVYALVRELGLHTFPSATGGRQVLDRGGQISTYTGTIPPVGLLNLLPLQLMMTLVERWRRRVPAAEPWTAPDAAWMDARTLQSWIERVPSAVLSDLLRPAIRTVFGADPGEVGLLHFLAYVSSAGGFERLLDVEGGFQQDRVVEGAQAISAGLAARVGDVRLGCPVRAVVQDAGGVTVHTDAARWTASRVVVAVPLTLRSRIRFEPGLPVDTEQLHQRCPMGATTKVFVRYERAFWRERGLSGEAVCTEGPVSVTFDATAPGGPPLLLAFVVGAPARTWALRPAAERRAQVVDGLVRWFGPEAARPLWVEEQDWTTEPWSGGCPISQLPAGTLSVFGPALRRPVGRVHWAGTETARRCTGFMEGALESGMRVAEEVLGLEG
jgi:monoamine oxidase